MLPHRIVFVDSLPLAPSGKLDLGALSAGDSHHLAPASPPGSAAEEQIAAIWRKALDVADLDASGDFFELGGDSLSAIRAMAAVNEAFGVELALTALFEARTIRRLAEVVAGAKGSY